MSRKKAESGAIVWVTGMMFVAAVAVVVSIIGTVCGGNFWVGEGSALKAVQRVDPSATELVTLERNAWALSTVIVKDDQGNEKTFSLNANILQNVTAKPADE